MLERYVDMRSKQMMNMGRVGAALAKAARPQRPAPSGDYAYELKWDGFRCLVTTVGRLRVLSRQWWEMTPHLPDSPAFPATSR
jgi:ATP-dependent DNA ligase